MQKSLSAPAGSLFLAIGICLAGWFIGNGFLMNRASERYVSVKGLAERSVTADRAVWVLNFVAANDDLVTATKQLSSARANVLAFLEKHKVSTADTEVQNLRAIDVLARPYQHGTPSNRYLLQQSILVRTSDVQAVATAAQKVGELLESGVILGTLEGHQDSNIPYYLFTKLNDIKPDMIAEATANARMAAQQFAQDAETSIEGIKKAYQGQFRILPAEDAPGLVEVNQIHKKVRLVTSLDYILSQ